MPGKLCPCGGSVRLELSINFLVCKSCSEMLFANELVPAMEVCS